MIKDCKRFVIYSAIFLFCCLILSGCGLESFVFLNPPIAEILGSDSKFQFTAGSSNNETEFRGFEVYYKIYDPADSIDTSFNTFEEMVLKSFIRINNGPSVDTQNSLSRPLIKVHYSTVPAENDRGKNLRAIIDFSNPSKTTGEYPQITTVGIISDSLYQPVLINEARRGITYTLPNPPNEFKRFCDFARNDQDISPSIFDSYISQNFQIVLVLFAISYGIDTGTNLEVYSQPVWLGDEKITFPF
jgi:hypothetical protein